MFTRNRIEITGNVTKQAEVQEVGETQVAKARLMHNETFRRKDGGDTERVVAVDLEIWGKRGTAFAQHVNTKTPIHIEGHLQFDQWEQDGQARSRLLVRVSDWKFLSHAQRITAEREEEPTAQGRAKG